MAIIVRESPPPAPPAPFNPGKIPIGMEKAAQQQAELEREHARMKPKEAPTLLGTRPTAAPLVATLGVPQEEKIAIADGLIKLVGPNEPVKQVAQMMEWKRTHICSNSRRSKRE